MRIFPILHELPAAIGAELWPIETDCIPAYLFVPMLNQHPRGSTVTSSKHEPERLFTFAYIEIGQIVITSQVRVRMGIITHLASHVLNLLKGPLSGPFSYASDTALLRF